MSFSIEIAGHADEVTGITVHDVAGDRFFVPAPPPVPEAPSEPAATEAPVAAATAPDAPVDPAATEAEPYAPPPSEAPA